MTESRIISFIHSIRELDRLWRDLTPDERRAVLKELSGEISENALLIAIRTIRTGQPPLF